MLYCYPKLKNNIVYIYEKGKTYVANGMQQITVNRMFKDWNGKPLTFPIYRDAEMFCVSRNYL